MPVLKYSNYLEVSPTFESVVDIDADQRNPRLWQEYIVGADMEKLVEYLCQSLGNEAPDLRRSFWVHGSYGTGKSYAAIFVKHLLEERPETIDTFLSRSSRLAPLRSRFMKCRRNGDYLVVWKTGVTGMRSGDMMLLEAEKAVREALIAKFGREADLGSRSLIDTVRDKLNDESFNWDYLIENTTLGDDYTCVEELRRQVDAGDLEAIQRTAAVLRRRGIGLVDNLDTFRNWIGEVIDANGLDKSGIFFIWDEFTEYVSHSDDHTVMQQISEFCKVKPFFMLYVVHRSEEMVDSMGKSNYTRITERFHTAEFHISADAAFDLIRQSFVTRPNMDVHWADARQLVVRNIRPHLPEMAGLDDRISEEIDSLCPMHPMTIRLLSRVAESYAAAQRTLFRFMKDQSVPDQGFAGYINKYGPDDQACWLTPEWLWDYFFTRESDFRDKGARAAEFINHFEDSIQLVQNDENTCRVFKIALLLMAVMSSTSKLGLYGITRTQDGIAATVECLETCLAGTMSRELIRDKLELLEQNKLLNFDEHGGVTRLQLPFKSVVGDEFDKRLADNDKKYTRYKMFEKDGPFSAALEDRALDKNSPMYRRMKIAACCAETTSIKARLAEVQKELEKAPYKLGLLLVTVKDDTQYIAIQTTLAELLRGDDGRLTIALMKTPFSDDKRKDWLTRLTKYDLANDAGNTGSATQFKNEMAQIVATWVGATASGSRIIAWNRENVHNNIYGTAQLLKIIEQQVLQEIFPCAPEAIVPTNTAYKPCIDSAPLAGIQRATNNSQLKSVLTGLQTAGLLDAPSIEALAQSDGSRAARAIAELARLVSGRMAEGNVALSELWETLQRPPFGYYDTIACGILLGFVFAFYKNSVYCWIDNAQASHTLVEPTLKNLILNLCKGRLTTDTLSAGSVLFRNFRGYAQAIFSLDDAQVATEPDCWRNIREVITRSGAPLWAMKYLGDEAYANAPARIREAAPQVIDLLQQFVMQEGDRDNIMSEIFEQMKGRGRVRDILRDALQNKEWLAAALRRFLFETSPELERIADKLHLQPIMLSDKIRGVMQAAIYSWTEEQVREKLPAVALEYVYLDALNGAIGIERHSIEEARRDLLNVLRAFRISIERLERLGLPWFDALLVLRKVAESTQSMDLSNRERAAVEIDILNAHGREAMSALRDAKPLLGRILESAGVECTQEELNAVYAGLRDVSYNASIGQFESALNQQLTKISQARNRALLLSKWTILTGEESVKSWCRTHKLPIFWAIPSEYRGCINVVNALQRGTRVLDDAVQGALRKLEEMDASLLTDEQKLQATLLETIGADYSEFFQQERAKLLAQGQQYFAADMSSWKIDDVVQFQRLIRDAQAQKARQERLPNAKRCVERMDAAKLRERVCAFLDENPRYCEKFME